MIESADIALAGAARRLRLDTLVRLRWLAVIGQSIAVAVVHFALGFPFAFGPAFLIIAVSAWLNVALRIRYPMSHRLSDRAALLILSYDILQLAALLYLTGGLQNPFSLLFLAPVLISATALPPRRTFVLIFLAIAAASLLAWRYQPLPWFPNEMLRLPFLYVVGIWLALCLGMTFIAVYAWRVAEEARMLGEALAATELVLAREQHLSQLDGLAAAAAHELGTPLATISLVAKEMSRQVERDDPLADDIELMREQAGRCRDILSKLTSLSAGDAGPLETLTLPHLIEEIAGPQRPFGTPIRVKVEGDGPPPACRRNAGIIYGLGNLVENAADFAEDEVRIEAGWDDRIVRIVIRDDGPGFAPEVLLHLGEPYLTTRGPARSGQEAAREGGVAGGLGLGLFIAKTLLERSGAALSFASAMAPATGAVVSIAWPRQVFEAHVAGGPAAAALAGVGDRSSAAGGAIVANSP